MMASRRSGGDESGLCCCEYINMNGERSHLLACCCDCEAVDEAAENLISCRPVPSHLLDRILDVVLDRCRLPWLSASGARRVQLDRALPIVTVPVLLYFATYGPVHTVISFLLMPLIIVVFHKIWRRTMKTRRNDFFFFWGFTSVIFDVITFETAVISFREVYLWENLTLLTLTALAIYVLQLCRLEPGYVRRGSKGRAGSYLRTGGRRRDASRGDEEEIHILEEQDKVERQADKPPADEVSWIDSRPFVDGYLETWCSSCQVEREPRSGHCTICNWCVEGRDHHCVWINSCVGARNHRSFVLAWLLIVFVGFYGCQLSLTSVCTPEMYADWFLLPNDCRFVYGDIYNGLAFVTALYTLIATVILFMGLIHQLILIGQNLTMQEFHRAGTRGMLRYGFIAQNNVNYHGFLRNVRDFWSGRRQLSYDRLLRV